MNPYAKYLGDRDPLTVLIETPQRIRALNLTGEALKRAYEPGKWDAARIFGHLVHCEMMFGSRFRQAATQDNFTVQPFDQDAWMNREPVGDGEAEKQAFLALREWNLPFYRSLGDSDLSRKVRHLELGEMDIFELMSVLAGHDLNHLGQLEKISAGV